MEGRLTQNGNRMLIVQADDLGMASAVNEAVREAYNNGFLTSTNLITNGPAFDEAVQEIIPSCPGLGIGLHLNIVQGCTQRENFGNLSSICDSEGRYKVSFGRLLQAQISGEKKIFNEIEDDFRCQMEIVLAQGIQPDHLSSHRHFHSIPKVFEIACKLASEYQIPFVRLVREPFYFGGSIRSHLKMGIWYPMNLLKHFTLNALWTLDSSIAKRWGIRTNDRFVGISYTGRMNADTVMRGLRSLSSVQSGIIEVLLHPCKVLSNNSDQNISSPVRSYLSHPARSGELATLTNKIVSEFIQENGWELTSYFRLAKIGDRLDGPRMAVNGGSGPRKETNQ